VTRRDPFAAYRERMAEAGFRPSRKLGQNFLLEPELHRLIADVAEVGAEDVVLEIGAGLGFLTRELLRRARLVVAVEIDARLCALLREDIARLPEAGRLVLVHGDVLASGGRLDPRVPAALAAAGGQYKVAANLPYAVTGPALAALCTADRLAERMALLVQLEVAERLVAEPGTKEHGGLGVLVQACYEPRLVRRVGREVFRPRPNVDSAVVELAVRPPGPQGGWQASERASFASFLQTMFSFRRKTVRQGLRLAAEGRRGGVDRARSLTVRPEVLDARPDQLSAPELLDLWQTVRPQP
jgi:16S rRNA (adenine1518-N6/adenine1519-N6)-dimethyltransferase